MRTFFTFLTVLCVGVMSWAQSGLRNDFWRVATPTTPEALAALPPTTRTLKLDLPTLQTVLATAPMEFTAAAKSNPVIVTLPLADGTSQEFEVVNSPVMSAALAAQWSQFATFAGRSLTQPGVSVRLGYTALGFHATVMGKAEGVTMIAPITDITEYAVYHLQDVAVPAEQRIVKYLAPTTDDEQTMARQFSERLEHSPANFRNNSIVPVTLRRYRFALACTGEFAAQFGGTVESVTSAFVTFNNVLNAPLMRDIAMRFELIDNNTELIHLNSTVDPYPNGLAGLQVVSENGSIMNSIVGYDAYDIGHCLTGGCTDGVGGVAAGQACYLSKGNGVTCVWGSSVSALTGAAIQIAAHEIGHQFAGGHTFNNCPGSEGQRASGSAAEPGSGSTLMSYAGLCGSQNIQGSSDDYYHAMNLREIITFTREDIGNVCPVKIETTNHFPIIDNFPYEDDFFIPVSTPFELSASASDPDGDALAYNWEQMDVGPSSDIGSPMGDAPLFRSIYPNPNPTRVFPKIQTILNNSTDPREVLPSYSRNLTFHFVVRDNVPTAGGVVWEALQFKATQQAGPFVVTSPNTATIWEVGRYMEVKWNVANTDNAPVNCKNVDIYLSNDGGLTYPTLLIANTLNDGSEFITVPNVVTTNARIKVKAHDNIFFDISNANFTIVPPSAPGYTLDISPRVQGICLPNLFTTTLSTSSLLNYNSPITFEVLQGLPQGATATITPATVQPGQSATLTIDLNNVNVNDTFTVGIRATAMNTDTAYREVQMFTVANDFSAFALLQPVNGLSNAGTLPAFSWSPTPNATSYELQIATNPSFDAASMVVNKTGLTQVAFVPAINLDENKLYFWRVRPVNSCGAGAYSPVYAFHTLAINCVTNQSIDVPVFISSGGTPTIESFLDITTSGTISDLNVSKLQGIHDYIGDLEIDLVSPAGTVVKLFYDICGNLSDFNIQLDDEAPTPIPCPAVGGQKHRPQGSLSDFIGQNTQGSWKLRVHDDSAGGGGGALEAWGLEFCADAVLTPPTFVINDTMPLPVGATRQITNEFLAVADANNTPEQLTFTLVTPPQHGTLLFAGQPMSAGGTFRQSTINAGNLAYRHDGGTALTDNFTFTVQDGEGGWLPMTSFATKIHNSVIISTYEPNANGTLAVYPNPVSDVATVVMPTDVAATATLQVFNVQGQLLLTKVIDATQPLVRLQTKDLANGLYVIKMTTTKGTYKATLSVMH